MAFYLLHNYMDFIDETDFLRFFMFFISLIVMFLVILDNIVLYYNAYFICYISAIF